MPRPMPLRPPVTKARLAVPAVAAAAFISISLLASSPRFSYNTAVAFDAQVQHMAVILLPPAVRKYFHLGISREALCFDPAADLANVDHAIAHHSAVIEQVGRGAQPIADVQGQQALL